MRHRNVRDYLSGKVSALLRTGRSESVESSSAQPTPTLNVKEFPLKARFAARQVFCSQVDPEYVTANRATRRMVARDTRLNNDGSIKGYLTMNDWRRP